MLEDSIPEQLSSRKPFATELPSETPTGTSPALLLISRIVSIVFTPFMAPLFTFVILFFFTYLHVFPLSYKLYILSLVSAYTVFIPMLTIYAYQKLTGGGIRALKLRHKRFAPYLFTILSYIVCLITMYRMSLQRFMIGIILSTLICMILCTLTNLKWKISTHTASSGMMVGFLLSFGLYFYFNPILWLCGFILLSGLLGTARIVLRHHTLLEVSLGFFVGLFCGIIGFLFL